MGVLNWTEHLVLKHESSSLKVFTSTMPFITIANNQDQCFFRLSNEDIDSIIKALEIAKTFKHKGEENGTRTNRNIEK